MAIARFFNDSGGTIPDGSSSGSEHTDDLTSQINGQKTSFTLSYKYVAGALRGYYNGIRQSGDKLIADYEKSDQ